jgi:cell division protein FtsQ
MKRILGIIAAVVLLATLLVALFLGQSTSDDAVCRNLVVFVKDSADRPFLQEKDIVAMLKNARLYPVGRPANRINTDSIEKIILKNELIASVHAYKTSSGNVKVEITQKMPVLRVFSGQDSYYVDDMGCVMPANFRHATCLPVASGKIEKSFATTDLFKFALFLQKHSFWNHQIEQIYVRTNKDVELIPRVGNCRIMLGSLENFEEKLENLRLFYEQAVPKVGWEKYEIINLKYKNQIVCSKK